MPAGSVAAGSAAAASAATATATEAAPEPTSDCPWQSEKWAQPSASCLAHGDSPVRPQCRQGACSQSSRSQCPVLSAWKRVQRVSRRCARVSNRYVVQHFPASVRCRGVCASWRSVTDWRSLRSRAAYYFIASRSSPRCLHSLTHSAMDSLLLIGAVAVLAVGGFLWMRSAAANKEGDDGKGQAWRGTGATNVDPLLRNRQWART